MRPFLLVFVAVFAVVPSSLAQQAEPYAAPRTAQGHPDLQGVWVTEFLTMLERPPGVDGLVLSPEQAQGFAAALRDRQPEVIDPQVGIDDVRQLAMVRGEYRSSVIVEPENGQMPFTQAGLDLVACSRHADVRWSGSTPPDGALSRELRVSAHADDPHPPSEANRSNQRPRRHPY